MERIHAHLGTTLNPLLRMVAENVLLAMISAAPDECNNLIICDGSWLVQEVINDALREGPLEHHQQVLRQL